MARSAEHARSVAALLDEDYSLSEVIGSLASVADQRTPVFIALVAVRPESKDRLSTKHHGRATFETLSNTARTRVMRLELHGPKFETYPEVILRVDRIGDGPVAVVIAVCPAAIWNEAFGRFMAAAAPRYFSPFLRQSELRAVFETMQAALPANDELRLRRVSGLRRLTEGTSRRSFQPQIEWPDLPYATAFERAREDSTFFKRAAFKVCKRDEAVSNEAGVAGGLTNFAEFRVNANVVWLYESGVRTAIAIIEKQFRLAHDRGRTEEDGAHVKALAANFTEAPITIERLPAVAARLKKMPRASVSILHGNPYLHASIVDHADGSIFDFVLVSSSRALLMPQGRATEGAVTRLCKFIYEQIGEADFRDATDATWTEAT